MYRVGRDLSPSGNANVHRPGRDCVHTASYAWEKFLSAAEATASVIEADSPICRNPIYISVYIYVFFVMLSLSFFDLSQLSFAILTSLHSYYTTVVQHTDAARFNPMITALNYFLRGAL